MLIDERTRQDLEMDPLMAYFQPLTPLGKRLKHQCSPFLPGQEAEWQQLLTEQENIQKQFTHIPEQVKKLEKALRSLPDPTSILKQLADHQTPGLTEWFQLKQFLWNVKTWAEVMQEGNLPPHLHISPEQVELLEELLWKLNPEPPLTPAFYIADAYDERLKKVRQELRRHERALEQEAEAEKRALEEKYGFRRNRLGEWVIQRGSQLDETLKQEPRLLKVRETIYDSFYTLSSFFQEERQAQVERLKQQMEALEQNVCLRLAGLFRPHLGGLEEMVKRVTYFDLQWARLRAAENWQGVKPEYDPEQFLLEEGFHPVVAKRLQETGLSFTPLHLQVKTGVTVIIGPNMGGKTVALKTVGLVAVLAQYGFFVPARVCKMPLFPWVTTIIGDEQSIHSGLSSFGAEVVRLGEWIERKEAGLLLLDEIGRGTNPVEGSALSQAVTQHLVQEGKWSVHVTHYREVMMIPGIRGYRVAGLLLQKREIDRTSLATEIHRSLQKRMDYRLLPLEASDEIPEEAITIAEMLGIKQCIIAEARKLIQKG